MDKTGPKRSWKFSSVFERFELYLDNVLRGETAPAGRAIVLSALSRALISM